METEQLILVETFCSSHNIEWSFISSLEEYGLVEITKREDTAYIPESNLKSMEQLVRLHNDLNINVESLDAILYLLDQIKEKEAEINMLKNRMRLYET
ncbi:MAG: chaperone modulator CbpM [Ferruginibacter sp.]